jgi:hypothetical protein
MSNPFAGIITAEMKTLWQNMIDALLEDDALTLPCRLIYEGSKEDPISGGNPVDPIGNKPPAVFLHGGPRYAMHGDAVEDASSTDTLNLCVIWDSRDWIRTVVSESLIAAPNMHVQTLIKIEDLVELKRVDKLVIDTDLEGRVRHVFQRASEPEPCGFGASTHAVIMWKKIGGV